MYELTSIAIVALSFIPIVAVIWRVNEWHARHRASLTPAEREAEDREDARTW